MVSHLTLEALVVQFSNFHNAVHLLIKDNHYTSDAFGYTFAV